jgi:hypothetical protein
MGERKYLPARKIPDIEHLREFLLETLTDKDAVEDYIKALYELPEEEQVHAKPPSAWAGQLTPRVKT